MEIRVSAYAVGFAPVGFSPPLWSGGGSSL